MSWLGVELLLSVSDLELRSLSPENFAKIEVLRNRYEREVVAILQRPRSTPGPQP